MSDLVSNKPISTSVGDYLKAIWSLAGTGSASTNALSERLSVAPASVSNMFVRLQEMGLARHERYHGASLTDSGRVEALRLVRRHRLIETFLLEHLGYHWQEVHDEAERLEHAVSDGFTERLAEFLGHPQHDPHGDPIPSADGTLSDDDSFPLGEAPAGSRVRVRKVADDATVLDYLEEHGLVPGRVLEVVEVRALDGVVTVRVGEETRSLGQALTQAVFVRREPAAR
jgi:DtxR family Mn-dependent transcriptional regulator